MTLGRNMNVVAVLRTSEAKAALDEAWHGVNGTPLAVHVGRLDDVRPGVDILEAPDALLLDVDPRDEGEVEHLQKVVGSYFPNTPVIATAREVSLQDIRQLMRLGIVDFVPQPFTRADLESALSHAARVQLGAGDSTDGRGKVITFIKAGGGVGATTLAVQAACALAEKAGKAGRSVCLMDLDIQFGTAALYLDVDNRVGLTELMENPDRLDGELLRSVVARHDSGLDVLAAPHDMIALDAVVPEFLSTLLKTARSEYRTIILDLPEVWTPWTYRAIQSSDLIILVTQLTVAGVRQARRQIDTMEAHGLEDIPLKVALNRYEKGWGKSVHLGEAEKALGRKFDYHVANDYKTVSEALNQGVALSKIKRKSKAEQNIRKMIEAAVAAITGEIERAEPRLTSGLRR